MSTDLDVYYDVVHVEIVGPYTLHLTVDDETEQTIDFADVLQGPVFEPLHDLELFNQVSLNKDTGTIEWPTGADLNPVVLHDWPNYKAKVMADMRARHVVPA